MNKKILSTFFIIVVTLELSFAQTPPNAQFTANPLSGFAPLEVQFTNTSTGEITAYEWKFGDLDKSTEENPSYTFTSAGKFDVVLFVTGPGGADTLKQHEYIIVHSDSGGLTAGFDADPLAGFAPLDVQFTNTSTGEIDSYQWDFGDGGKSTEENPSHEFIAAGKYDITLVISGSSGKDSLTQKEHIIVHEPPGVGVRFSANPLSGFAPLDVQFTIDTVDSRVTNYFWDFGDSNTSTEKALLHTYESEGNYTVTLIVDGTNAADTLTIPDYIIVNDPNDLDIEFSAEPLSGFAPLGVQFKIEKIDSGVTDFYWNFGDNNSSPDKEPYHTYESEGTFTVTIIVDGTDGSDTLSKPDYIMVNDSTTFVQAKFTADPQSGEAPLTVNFYDESIGNITHYEWDFDDGSQSTVQNPVHTFNSTGSYNVTLKVSGPEGADSVGASMLISVGDFTDVTITNDKPDRYYLSSNYPNPFNPNTIINYQIKESGFVLLKVYDLLGKEVAVLVNEFNEPGFYSYNFNAKNLSSGIYIYRLQINNFVSSKKMLLSK